MMVSSIWVNRIRAAFTEEEILSAIRDFVAAWMPADVDRLPKDCRPGAISDLDGLISFGNGITNCYRSRRHDPGAAYLLKEIVEVFTAAIDRAEQIKRRST